MKKIVAFVPVKLNNERCPGKNIRELEPERPLITYILNTLKKVSYIDEIYVYCSQEEIIPYLPIGVRFLKRDSSLDRNDTKILDVLKSFANDIFADIYVLAHATAPFLRALTIEEGIIKVLEGEYDSAFTVRKSCDFMWNEDGPMNYDSHEIPRTQDLPPCYVETTGLYLYERDLILKEGRRIGDRPYKLVVDSTEAVDINEETDFETAKAICAYEKEKIKVIGIDLDGTLLSSKKTISEQNRKAIETAAKRGVSVVIVTGRPLAGIEDEVRQLRGISYWITANGANITKAVDDVCIYRDGMSVQKVVEILKCLTEFDVYYDYYYQGFGYTDIIFKDCLQDYIQSEELTKYVKKTRHFESDFPKKLIAKEDCIEKVNLFFRSEREREWAREQLMKIEDVEITSGMPNNLEINAKKTSKGKGIMKLAGKLGYEPEQIMVIGDSENDISMLKVAGCSVVMENATEFVKEYADIITESNDKDGVAKAISQKILA